MWCNRAFGLVCGVESNYDGFRFDMESLGSHPRAKGDSDLKKFRIGQFHSRYYLTFNFSMAHKDLWVSILQRLQPTIRKANFMTWFQGTTVIDNKDGVLKVGLPTSFACSWVGNKYGIKILQAAKEIDPTIEQVECDVCGKLANKENEGVDLTLFFKEESTKKKVKKISKSNEVRVSKGVATGHVSSQALNVRYDLDNFVVGGDNRLPHAACVAVSNTPGGIYNPLYVYGKVGLGKTHLIQSIGNSILKNFPDMIVKYVTAERFVSEVVDAIGKRQMSKFKEQYRKVDCLLIDDVQFFARKNSSQQEFFHTFNTLYDMNKQIVLTSDRPPSELDELDERLKSRFGMGMVVELLLPDFETRLAILNQKCREYQAIIAPEVLSFIANNVHNSVRELEGVLKQAIAEAQLSDSVPTIRSVAQIIKRLNKAQEIIGYDLEAKRELAARAKTALDVKGIVAVYYRLTTDDLVGKARKKEINVPRQVCMYLIKHELNQSYESIGEEFGGRNHTTVMHACNKTADRLKTDLNLVKDVNAIKREMGL